MALVLVVDDDMDVRDAYQAALEHAGFEAVTLGDGRLALDYLKSRRPDLILMDVVMPRMDGFELRRAQLQDPELAKVPTIVVTADRLVPSRWLETNLAAVLIKPVQLCELVDAANEAIRGASPPTGG